MDLETLRTFVAVAQHGGVLAAARALRTPKQTVSRRLAQLEAEVGAPLLERDRKPLALTDAGRLFAERCLSIVASADAAVAELQPRGGVATGTLRVASPALFARLFLAPALSVLAQRHPLVRVELLATDSLEPSAPWEFDVVIWLGPLPDVRFRPVALGQATNVVCAAPALAASLAGVEPAALAGARAVLYSRSARAPVWRLVRGSRTVEVPVTPWLRTNDPDVALSAARAGLGVTSLPGVLVAADLRAGRLQRLLPDWRVQVGAITALYRPGARPLAAVRTLLDALGRAVAAGPPPDLADAPHG